eukprot:SM003566S13161  [mRNA]  locus=s3566:24:1080:- [translate_table: standard]
MVFTPLLASTCVGTLEFRSVAEPVKVIQPALSALPNSHFFLANCITIDPARHEILCREVADGGVGGNADGGRFRVAYDKLVIATGGTGSTFGIAGVEQHATQLRDVGHAMAIRRRLLLNLARSEIPGVSEEEKRRLLHCVVVGGGPTGVEFAGELSDFIRRDVKRKFAHVKGYIKVTLIEVRPTILTSRATSLAMLHKLITRPPSSLLPPPVVLTQANEILSSFDVRLRDYATQQLSRA